MNKALSKSAIYDILNRYISKAPGLQYMVTKETHTIFEYTNGWADVQNRRPMTLDTTMMAYSMTKVFTAIAILQLAEQGKLDLNVGLDSYLADTPYTGHNITIRQILDHTSGIPNPIPLRWVHLTEEHPIFNEESALARVLHDHPKLAFEPGQRFAYSNVGYWLLGKIVERAAGKTYTDYLRTAIIEPLGLSSQEMNFAIPDPTRHAKGYLAKYSFTNLLKSFITDRKFWGGYEGNWLRLKSHYPNGPSFGGLVGTARSFTCFLQDQLRTKSVLLNNDTRQLLETRQTNKENQPIAMTLGWHIGETNDSMYFFKQGGGGGFHSEMRIYRSTGIASVVMTNSTTFNSTGFLNQADREFFTASS
jgi:D-alanyl-D-alanine carboxypeptidase